MVKTIRYETVNFVVSGITVPVRIPASWQVNSDHFWQRRGPQVKALLRSACREKFGVGILYDGNDGYKWLRARVASGPVEDPSLVQLIA